MSRKFKKLKKRRFLALLLATYILRNREVFSLRRREIFDGESSVECKFLEPAVTDSWYKPRVLSSPITHSDFHHCAKLTIKQKAAVALINNSCRSNIEIFSSCSATGMTMRGGGINVSSGIRFTLNTTHKFGLIKVPGLGLERRDFSLEKKKTDNMADWGDGSKRLEFELRPVHDKCEYFLGGLTYMVRAYHMWNLGHFYETIFRLYLEVRNRSDLSRVKQIIILNAEKELPFLALLEQLFPDVRFISPRYFSTKLVCIRNGIFVGFPNHALGRSDTSQEEVTLFHEFLCERFNLQKTKSSNKISRPLVVFMSRNALPDSKRARRHLQNEGEVAEMLRKRTNWDVRIVSMQRLTFQEQAELMYETSLLISVHTAGFYNVLFMQPGSIAVQINVPGTHFGTLEYERRPQQPFWMRGMWHTPVQQICMHRGIVFLELWAEADPSHSKNFVRSKQLGTHKMLAEYAKWASTNIKDFEDKWKVCNSGKTFFNCFDGIANEMRAHSTADVLSVNLTKLLEVIQPHISCIGVRSCKE